MDEASFDTAHLVGNSLGGYVALQLAARGRAETVVAFAPAGGWARGDESYKDLLALQSRLVEQAKAAAPTRNGSWRPRRAGAARHSS
jgi:pimeloyl-ACP methyl ester carboxylesterase